MPIYVYACDNGHEHEDFSHTLRKSNKGPECPECGKPTFAIPTSFKGYVSGGTPTHYPDRKENK